MLIDDLGGSSIAYLEMPLDALERGMGLMKQVREGLSEVTAPALLVYRDTDEIVDKANGPFVLDQIASTDKRPTAPARLLHELTLDVDRERIMVEVYDFIRARS